jgi:uncharacterized iron-regulated membrane protein
VVHRLVGGVALIVGTVVGLTGALLVVAALVSAGAAPSSSARLIRPDFVAAHVPPSGRVVALVAEPAHRVRVEMLGPDGGLSSVVVNAETGDRAAAPTPRDHWDIVRRLHGGDFGGWPFRLLYAAVGLALPVLSVTGFLLSLRRGAPRSNI